MLTAATKQKTILEDETNSILRNSLRKVIRLQHGHLDT